MPKILSQAQIEQYGRDGLAFPVPVLEAAEVRTLRADLEYWEKQQGHPLEYPEKSKSYLLYRWPTRWCITRECSTRSRT